MFTTRFSIAALFAATPLAALLIVGTSACILEDDFLKQQNQFACTIDADCSEPGFFCVGGFCNPNDVPTPCIDLDEDGYGSNEDRSQCEFVQIDKDDDCAACTPVAKETCDGFDNDTNGEIDEPVACSGSSSATCPGLENAPAGAFWTCQNSQCVLIPPLRAPGSACETLTISCVGGSFDDTEARANGCFP